MQAIQVHVPGPSSVMRLESISDPSPGADEVLIKVRAVGVNPVDTYIRSGKYKHLPAFPYIPGNDVAGVIIELGSEVTGFSIGERVYVIGTGLGLGGYAELIACHTSAVTRIPANITFQQAAAINVPYATAHRALVGRGQLKSGDTVLIHGASGGVGIAAVQLAVAAGATVIGTAGSPRGIQLVRDNGAQHCFNHVEPDYLSMIREVAPGGIDLIIENLANVNLAADIGLVAAFGRVVIVGSRGSIEIDPRTILQKDAVVCGMALWNATSAELGQIHAALFSAISLGVLKPVVGRQFPLADAPQAHDAVLEHGAFGKIILCP